MNKQVNVGAKSMLAFAILFMALALVVLLPGEAQAWSQPYTVPNSQNALTSDEAIDTSGNVHIVWYENTIDYHYYCYNPGTGKGCGSKILSPAFTGDLHDQAATAEASRPAIAIKPTDGTIYIAYMDPPLGTGKTVHLKRKRTTDTDFEEMPTRFTALGWAPDLATDALGNVHLVWNGQSGGVLLYRRFDASDKQVVAKTLVGSNAYSAAIVADSSGNASVAWEQAPNPREINVVQVLNNGTVGPIKNLTKNNANSLNAALAIDANDTVYLAYQDGGPDFGAYLQQCKPDWTGCSARKLISGAENAQNPSVTAIGTTPFISYHVIDPSTNTRLLRVWDPNNGIAKLSQPMAQLSIIRPSPDGQKLHLIYRLGSGNNISLAYTNQDSGLSPTSPTPTSTATQTATATQPSNTTNTPTATPTETQVPQVTNTPTVTPTATGMPPPVKPQRLTSDRVNQNNPSIARSANGDIFVAWDSGSSGSRDIYARVAPGGGTFNVAMNVSHNKTDSQEPSLLAGASGVYAFWKDKLGVSVFDIFSSTYTDGSWSTATDVSNTPSTSQDPAAVQATDGKIWVTWFDSTRTIFVTQVGGTPYTLSNTGTANVHPAIAAGANGEVYVAWTDFEASPGVHVAKWNGSSWAELAQPSKETTALWPSIAYYNGGIYAVWRRGMPTFSIKQRIWNGSSWNTVKNIGTGVGLTNPKISVPASGNVFVLWDANGAIKLKKNNNPAVNVSAGVRAAHYPSFVVDDSDVSYITYDNGDIWYMRYP